ncbi:putative transporter C3H1.06c [Ceratocystis fimbriata CBS 114723]|uniref:Putative transporter C3H1.06c n=1 Tax=Ceratocystis fimbriata CBS 114723 TaxID=1035309 RepID=A0A2C5WVK3_9PEZI|nr:putative transporter C3H1.06c [Ceratocystis fimbriata CBS 114723]
MPVSSARFSLPYPNLSFSDFAVLTEPPPPLPVLSTPPSATSSPLNGLNVAAGPGTSPGPSPRDRRSRATTVDVVPIQGPQLTRARQTVIMIGCLLGLFFSSLDAGIVSTSLVTISREFDDSINAPWVILAYLLTYMGFAVCVSRLSDIYGRRDVLLISWIIFNCFSMGCGASSSMKQLIICRAFQGIGGSGLYSLAQIAVVEMGPIRTPSLVGAMIGITLAIALVLGPILGGLISYYAGWRWIFNMNIPAGMAVSLLLTLSWPVSLREIDSPLSRYTWTSFTSIDFVGSGTLLCSSCLMIFALQQAGSGVSMWDSPGIVTAFTFSFMCAVIFVVWQAVLGRRYFAHIAPVFPLRLFYHRVFISCVTVTLLSGFPYFALTVAIPERFQVINGDNPLLAGLHLIPLLGSCAIGSFLAGALSSKRNNTSVTLIASSCLQLLGLGLMTTFSTANADVKPQYAFQAIIGLGVGMCFGSSTIIAALQIRNEDLASAQGAVAQARVLGGCFGLVMLTIVSHKASTDNALLNLELEPSTEIPQVSKDAYAAAFARETHIMVYVAVAMVLLSLFAWERNPVAMSVLAAHQHKDIRNSTETATEMSDMGSIRSYRARRFRL